MTSPVWATGAAGAGSVRFWGPRVHTETLAAATSHPATCCVLDVLSPLRQGRPASASPVGTEPCPPNAHREAEAQQHWIEAGVTLGTPPGGGLPPQGRAGSQRDSRPTPCPPALALRGLQGRAASSVQRPGSQRVLVGRLSNWRCGQRSWDGRLTPRTRPVCAWQGTSAGPACQHSPGPSLLLCERRKQRQPGWPSSLTVMDGQRLRDPARREVSRCPPATRPAGHGPQPEKGVPGSIRAGGFSAESGVSVAISASAHGSDLSWAAPPCLPSLVSGWGAGAGSSGNSSVRCLPVLQCELKPRRRRGPPCPRYF